MKSLEKKIKSVDERIQKLQSLAANISSFQDYQASPYAKDVAERSLQVAIEACLDIGKIIISSKKLEEPKDNKGIFAVLAANGIISPASLGFLIPMAGVRNILVHGYDKIDDALIYGILKRRTDDFSIFLKEIKKNYR